MQQDKAGCYPDGVPGRFRAPSRNLLRAFRRRHDQLCAGDEHAVEDHGQVAGILTYIANGIHDAIMHQRQDDELRTRQRKRRIRPTSPSQARAGSRFGGPEDGDDAAVQLTGTASDMKLSTRAIIRYSRRLSAEPLRKDTTSGVDDAE